MYDKKTLKNILKMIESQKFDDWYGDELFSYLEGDVDDEGKPLHTEEDILEDLRTMLCENS